jgi:hypothetical protein
LSYDGKNNEMVRDFWEHVFGECKLDLADKVLAEDCVLSSDDERKKMVPGRDGIKQLIGLLHEGLANLHVTVKEQVGGDRIAAFWEGSGDHTGEVLGIPPTHQKVKLQGVSICSCSKGEIHEIVERSTFTLMEPIGTPAEMFLLSWWRRHLATY